MIQTQTTTLIVGASISGLACAACLRNQGTEYTIIERKENIASPWRSHYKRLHLHTSKRFSNLPFKKFEKAVPAYPSREQVINYLESYRREFDIQPVFNTEARRITRENDSWRVETDKEIFQSKYLIIATGAFGKPRPVAFKGMSSFPGAILHSSSYSTGADFTGKNVLVVGFGNSACEIALDLYEQGAYVAMSVRSAVNVVPRDIVGLPILSLSIGLSKLSPRTADRLSSPLIRFLVGDLSRFGLKKKPYGPLEQIQRDGESPVLDVGTIRQIRQGHIKVVDDIDQIQDSKISFKDGKAESFDAIIAAIGYDRNYAELLEGQQERFTDLNQPIARQKYFGVDGLYFCGFWISPTGQIREIAMDARKIAQHISNHKIL